MSMMNTVRATTSVTIRVLGVALALAGVACAVGQAGAGAPGAAGGQAGAGAPGAGAPGAGIQAGPGAVRPGAGAQAGSGAARPGSGAAATGRYPNLFASLLGKTDAQVRAKIDVAWRQLFYGDSAKERIYYPVGDDMAFIEDILHRDVRTEGLSYGMMIAVQLGRQQEFDRIWTWTRTHLQHEDGPLAGYFAWQARPDGSRMAQNPASDGEEWFATALLFASGRWGDHGAIDYRAEANRILEAMLHKEDAGAGGRVTNLFDHTTKEVVFVPMAGMASRFTDPSYHLPHYYQLWARWAPRDNEFWCQAAARSRAYLHDALHPVTGLAPDYSAFDGRPFDPWGNEHADFRYDAWRVGANIGVDYAWFGADPWQVEAANRLLAFFAGKGLTTYGSLWKLDGTELPNAGHRTGLIATNAVAALAATDPRRTEFVRQLWLVQIPSGEERYYDGMLYFLALLEVSGNFRIYPPAGAASAAAGC